MVLPTMFEAGHVQPLSDTPKAWRTNDQRLFFVTDRQFDPDQGDFGRFTRDRSASMQLGHLQIDLGPKDAWQHLDAATRANPDGKRPRPTLTSIERHGNMRWDPAGRAGGQPIASNTSAPERLFVDHLEKALQASHGQAITIYIHGFKNSFEKVALTVAELQLYSGGLGPFILYSWPSYNDLFEYSHDRDSVRYTTAHARRFVEFLANEIKAGNLSAKKINLVAHSSGAEVVGSVLRELGLMSYDMTPEQRRERWKIGNVLLVAPDISTDVARERILKEDLRGMCDKIVVYSSQKDSALRWASRFLYRAPRIGSISETELTDADRYWLSKTQNVTLINVDTQPNGDPVSHSHHRYSSATLSDLLLSLRTDLPPDQRGLTRNEGAIIWNFSDDYKQRVTEAAKKTYDRADNP